jgi:hypothetical protein
MTVYDINTARDRCHQYLPSIVLDALTRSGGNAIVAGGFCRDIFLDDDPNDIDIFFTSLRAHDEFLHFLETSANITWQKLKNCTVVGLWPKAAEGNIVGAVTKIHLVTKEYYQNVPALLRSFDFTCCQAAFWYREKPGYYEMQREFVFYATKKFLQDAKTRTLRYTYPKRKEVAAGSFMRMLKFLRRGWRAPRSTIAAVTARMLAKMHEEDGKEILDEYEMCTRLDAAISRWGNY